MNSTSEESYSEQFSELLVRLREASALHETNARYGAIYALNAVGAFLLEFKEVRDEGLAIPLGGIASALIDLENGIRTPLLTQKSSRGRSKKSSSRKILIAHVATTRELLIEAGYEPQEVTKKIAECLNSVGVKNLG